MMIFSDVQSIELLDAPSVHKQGGCGINAQVASLRHGLVHLGLGQLVFHTLPQLHRVDLVLSLGPVHHLIAQVVRR